MRRSISGETMAEDASPSSGRISDSAACKPGTTHAMTRNTAQRRIHMRRIISEDATEL